jgi:hypothetical protein
MALICREAGADLLIGDQCGRNLQTFGGAEQYLLTALGQASASTQICIGNRELGCKPRRTIMRARLHHHSAACTGGRLVKH